MKIQRVETRSFAISEGAEKKQEKKLRRSSPKRLLNRAVFHEEAKLIKSYRPLAKFKVSRMVRVHKGLVGDQTLYETKENSFYIDLSSADLYTVQNGRIKHLDIIRKLLSISPESVQVFGKLMTKSFVYEEEIDKKTLFELEQLGYVQEYKSSLLSLFKGIWDELNPEQQPTVVKERVKAGFKMPKFANPCYDLSQHYLESDTIDETYARDNIKYPLDPLIGVLSDLFEAKVGLEGVTYMPYLTAAYRREDQHETKSPDKKYPLCSVNKRGGIKKTAGKLKPISLSMAIGEKDSVPMESEAIDFSDIGGMEEVKKEIQETLIYPLMKPELAKDFGKKAGGAVLLYGPPGCGKSYIAKAIIGEAGIPFFNVSMSEIVGRGVKAGAESLHEVFAEAARSAPSAIFFDEIDAIGGRREKTTSYEEKMEIDQFLMEMDGVEGLGENMLVIAATNAPWNIDPALRRSVRFTKHMFIPPPDKEAREKIFKVHLRNRPISEDVNTSRLAELTEDYSASDIKVICDTAADFPWEEALESGKERKITMQDFLKAISQQESSLIPWFKLAYDQIRSSGEAGLFEEFSKYIMKYGGGVDKSQKPDIDFSDVGGMEEVKEEIRKLIVYPMKNPELFKEYKQKLGGSILLYGPPGCGKTYIARATAGECDVSFFNVKLTDILSEKEGASEKNIRQIFERASKNAPAILFFDEMDAVAGRRDRLGSERGKRLVDAFLTEMDGFNKVEGLVIIAATNAPWDMDPALRRSERFTKQIFIPSPNEKAREEIFRIHAKEKPIAKDIDFKSLAEATEGYSASDIKVICDLAAEIPWGEALHGSPEREVGFEDFAHTIDNYKNSLSVWYRSAEKQITESGESDLYERLLESIKEFKEKESSSTENIKKVLAEEKRKTGLRSQEEKEELRTLISEKAELEKKIDMVRAKYHRGEINEGLFEEALRDYERQLIEVDVKTEVLKGKEEEAVSTELSLSGGLIYSLEERNLEKSLQLFLNETQEKPGLWISRQNPPSLEIPPEPEPRDVTVLRLMETGAKDGVVSPQVEQLFSLIGDFLDKGGKRAVFLEGIEYLITHNSFQHVLKLIQALNDKVSSTDSLIVITLTPEALGEKELVLLRKEMQPIT